MDRFTRSGRHGLDMKNRPAVRDPRVQSGITSDVIVKHPKLSRTTQLLEVRSAIFNYASGDWKV